MQENYVISFALNSPSNPLVFDSKDSRTRQKILDVALELFITKGYDGTSINDIRSLAGFRSKSSLYTYFTSKEQISDELTTHIVREIDQIILQAYHKAENDPIKQLEAIFTAYITWGLTNREKFVFRVIRAQEKRMLEGEYDFQKNPELITFCSNVLTIFEKIEQNSQSLRKIPHEALFHMMIGAISRAVIDQSSFGDIPLSEQVKQVLEVSLGIPLRYPS